VPDKSPLPQQVPVVGGVQASAKASARKKGGGGQFRKRKADNENDGEVI